MNTLTHRRMYIQKIKSEMNTYIPYHTIAYHRKTATTKPIIKIEFLKGFYVLISQTLTAGCCWLLVAAAVNYETVKCKALYPTEQATACEWWSTKLN